jgi:phosphatidylserine/phosphatidylglycerophosphate/cardiolipin synthase-like enzyme
VEPVAATVRIVCTSPARVLPRARGGATEILDALLEGIDGARSLIYVEHQYLSARPVVSALTQALHREPELELIVVLNENPDVTAYQRWQNARLAEAGLLEHPRAGVFALWTAARDTRGSGATALNQVFVHSKVVVVDDRWATSGSANLDGVSLYSYGDDFTGTMGRRVFRNVRNFDVNVVVSDNVDDDAVRGSRPVADLRARLWSEHLELPAGSLARRPPAGWLRLWRGRAAANVVALGRPGSPDEMCGFVLPYSAQRTPALQLIDLGLHIDPARIDVRFNPGWLEVQFSPNWVRNMFV